MDEIFEEIKAERARQDQFWGEKFDAKNTANDWVAYIVRYVSTAAYDGRERKFTNVYFRSQMIKAAALCIAAIEALDKNELAPRHYDVVEPDPDNGGVR
jgi:hypothetical protein